MNNEQCVTTLLLQTARQGAKSFVCYAARKPYPLWTQRVHKRHCDATKRPTELHKFALQSTVAVRKHFKGSSAKEERVWIHVNENARQTTS